MAGIPEQKTYEYVFGYFYNKIMDGSLKLGDKVATERDLVQELGVSRSSVREAFHTLEMMGLLECVQGSGNYVCCKPRSSLMNTVSMLTVLQGIPLKEILDMRRSYELSALEMALGHISEAELQDMERTLTEMDHEEDTLKSSELDIRFHNILIGASGNQLLKLNVTLISDLLNHFIHDMRTTILEDPKIAAQLREAHWDVYHALVRKDLAAGIAAMIRHFDIDEAHLCKLEERNQKQSGKTGSV